MKRLSIILPAIAALAIGLVPAARANEIRVIGYTDGCMGAGCVPSTSPALQTGVLGGLTFQNATFDGMTSAGFLAFGANGAPIGTQNVNNLGAFTLTGTPFTYSGALTLRVTFTAPTTIVGGNTTLFSAVLTGNVTAGPSGGAFIDFDNTVQHYTFSNAQASGSFDFQVIDVSVFPNQTAPIDAVIHGSQSSVPEPATFGLIGAALVGLGAMRYRRRS